MRPLAALLESARSTSIRYEIWMLFACRRYANFLSQAVFAAILNTSVSTVEKREIGEKRPSGPSLKVLNVVERKGLKALG
jgi:DNA-binding transcriptional regulator YiaG